MCGHGISILPKLILKRILYKIITKELDIPAYRNIGLAVRNKKIFRWRQKNLSDSCNTDNEYIEILKYRNKYQAALQEKFGGARQL